MNFIKLTFITGNEGPNVVVNVDQISCFYRAASGNTRVGLIDGSFVTVKESVAEVLNKIRERGSCDDEDTL